MKHFKEDDLYVIRGRRPRTGVARANPTRVVHWAVWLLILGALLTVAMFIAIALLAKPAEITVNSNLPAEIEQGVPGTADPLVLVHNRIDLDDPLQKFALDYQQEHGVQIEIRLISGLSDYFDTLNLAAQSDQLPDLFLLEQPEDILYFQDHLTDLSSESWMQKTPFAYHLPGGETVGFPIDLNVSGMIYNQELLAKAAIDPTGLTNADAWDLALKTIERKKRQLGIKAPLALSMSRETGMSWTNGLALFNIYLSNGLNYGNDQMLQALLSGQIEESRLQQFAAYLEMLFAYSDREILVSGSYSDQLQAFASGQTVFMLAANWPEADLKTAGATFEYGLVPFGAYKPATNGLFVQPSAWLVLNQNSTQREEARQFLSDLAKAMQNSAFLAGRTGQLPAFISDALAISRPQTRVLQQWIQSGHLYGMYQNQLPVEFSSQILEPLIVQLADQTMTGTQFSDQLIAGVAGQDLNPMPSKN